MTLYVDPPEGWRYGFPKDVPKDREHDLRAWIIEQGYPAEMFDKHPLLRCWREEVSDVREIKTARAALEDKS